VAVDRRLLGASVGVALLVSVGGGYALSRTGEPSRTPADDEVTMDRPGEYQLPAIEPNEAVAGDRLPVVELEDADGNPISTAELIGQPLVVNFWYSTCGPCKEELPAFAAVHAELGDRIRFVGVNPLDVPEVNRSFARERGVRYELLRDTGDALASEVGIAVYPVTLFVDEAGVIVRQTGVLDADELRAHAAELVS